MSSEPLEDIAKGVIKGTLEWTADFIKQLAKGFQENKLKFIRDKENIEIAKEQYNSGELQIYKTYIEDKKKLMILRMGLVLRKLENKGEKEKKQNLREDIMKKYEIKGLHIAQFVENGILNRYIGILLDDISSIEKFKEKINEIIDNIERYVLFVKTTDSERIVLESCLRITTSNLSMIFIVSGMGSAAETIKKVEERLKELLKENYELEKMSKGDKERLFFKRILDKQ
ncbi:MAG TPA: hypothetical protein VJB35_05530 [Candidatus Nanoarchaeia archaeon]|nr:hypothetical protein [Candidatus Nanoarchaeia archaeon]